MQCTTQNDLVKAKSKGYSAHCSKVIGNGGQNVPDLLEQNQQDFQ